MTASEQDYFLFVQHVKKKYGINLSFYKEAQMKRRLTSLREKRGFSTFQEFIKAVDKNQELYNEFLDRMTINVSEFFRNGSRWDVLKDKIIPLLSAKRLKCWSSACSTGEEPYTLAMIFRYYYPDLQPDILATDIDEGAIKKAREGIYPERSLKEVPVNIKKKFFREDNGLFYLNQEIKTSVKYKKIDLLTDLFDHDYDLIICRNVMIYFTEEAKHLLYQKFSKALKPGGILFVGSTEQIFNPAQYQLETVDNFFYRKKFDK